MEVRQQSQSPDAPHQNGQSKTSGAQNILDNTKRTLSQTGEKLSQGYERAREGVREASSQVEDVVRKNPLIAVATAVGIGWVAGRFLFRSGGERNHRYNYRRGSEEESV